jgi:hypothetical protein
MTIDNAFGCLFFVVLLAYIAITERIRRRE